MGRLPRRRFLQGSCALVGLSLQAGCGVLPIPTPPTPKIPRLGFLAPGSRESQRMTVDGLLQAFAERGYVDGQTMVIDYRFGATEAELPELAAELVQRNVDLLFAHGTPASLAAKHATSTIPVVIYSSDPVGVGLVTNLARPAGNVTGMTNYIPQMTGKQLQLLLEAVPAAAPIAYLINPENPTYLPQEAALLAAASTLAIQVIRLEARTAAEVERSVQVAVAQRAAGLLVLADSLVLGQQRARIAELAVQGRLPTMFDQRGAALGGLLGYGANSTEEFRGRASYVERILKGARPADLPIEGPTTFDFAVNLKTAQALGLEIPPSLLQQATEIIQ